MKPWSKLQKRLYGIIDPRIDFQIHCVAYAMKSGKGSTALPRYYITLGKEIIWDYPKDFMEDASPGEVTLKNYPHENDASAISLLIEEYIETDKTILFHKEFISDRWGLTDILKSADRRIGRKRLQSLLKRVRCTRAKEIIYQRNELYEGMKDSTFPEYFARWLETNPPMKRKLIPLKRGKKDLDYTYEGIIPELFVSPHDSGLSIMAYYKNEYWDCIADFDVFVRLDVEKATTAIFARIILTCSITKPGRSCSFTTASRNFWNGATGESSTQTFCCAGRCPAKDGARKYCLLIGLRNITG